jgi:ABC-type dipeptide/oligopeptide/nickel transport system ATPase component
MAQFAQRVAVMRSGKMLEINNVIDIFSQPEHPYTRSLIASLPSLDRRDSYLNAPDAVAATEPAVSEA